MASKNGKVVSNLDVVNVQLKAEFEAVMNFEAELRVFEKAVKMLNSGEISHRGLKATIQEAEELGSLPTLKPSHAQEFVSVAKVRELAGAKDKKLKDVINATIQAKRAFKKEFEAKLEQAKSFADLVKMTPSQGERANTGRRSSSEEVIENIDQLIEKFNEVAESFEDITPKNPQEFERFLSFVATMSKAVRKSHPAGKALKVA